jgi:hypothetical protein
MLLLELTHTSHTAAATGIQQVCRRLFSHLSAVDEVRALVHDPFQCCWRTATERELERLNPDSSGRARRKGEAWTAREKLAGRLNMLRGRKPLLPAGVSAVLLPEFVMQRCIDKLPELRAQCDVPFAAVFHDCIALKLPQFSAIKTVQRTPLYLHALSRMDAVAAVSEASRRDLLDYWRFCGWKDVPPVEVIPLGVAEKPPPPAPAPAREIPLALCVGTLEGRKNHLALLAAAERLWIDGVLLNWNLRVCATVRWAHPSSPGSASCRPPAARCVWLGSVDEHHATSPLRGVRLHDLPLAAGGLRPALAGEPGARQALYLHDLRRPGRCLAIRRLPPPARPGADALADALRRVVNDPRPARPPGQRGHKPPRPHLAGLRERRA